MRRPKPYFKKSHRAWYYNIHGRPIRLASEAEGEKTAWDKYDLLMAGRQPVNDKWRVAELVQRFLAYHANRSAEQTCRFYARALDSFVEYVGPNLRVSDLRPYHITDWIDECHRFIKKAKKVGDRYISEKTDRPTTDTYRHNLVRAVKAAFRWAEDAEYIDRSPIRKVKLPPMQSRGDEAYLSPEQWAKVLAAAAKSRDGGTLLDFITILRETGCRPQEARIVEARHLDLTEQCWKFPRAESKGRREARVVHLTDTAFEICKRLAKKYPEGLRDYAKRHGGTIVKMFCIAETATKSEERKVFKEFLAHAKKHAHELNALLFYKVDRAARNLFDYVELERLEFEHGLEFISISQPTENNPAGRMQRRMLASMASYYTEQQSLDVKEGLERRVKEGWFVGHAPYGYRNVRVDGRGIVVTDPMNAPKVRRIFELFAYHNCTLDMLVERLAVEGIVYRDSTLRFPRSTLHAILRDRAYIGEIEHKGQWYPGKHEPLVDRATFDRVQALLGGQAYRCHEMTYAGDLITCGHCGRPITGERKTKKTKAGERDYVYYRCTQYSAKGHPRVRLTEANLDQQVLALFAKLRIEAPEVRDWVLRVLRARTREEQEHAREQNTELHRQLSLAKAQRDRLLNLRLLEEIEADAFAAKDTELRDRVAQIKLQIEAGDRNHDENADIAVKAFELSQSLTNKWLTADYAAKRQILEIVGLNWRLDDVTLIPEMRKPFDVLAEGLLSKESRGDKTPIELFRRGAASIAPAIRRLILVFLHGTPPQN